MHTEKIEVTVNFEQAKIEIGSTFTTSTGFEAIAPARPAMTLELQRKRYYILCTDNWFTEQGSGKAKKLGSISQWPNPLPENFVVCNCSAVVLYLSHFVLYLHEMSVDVVA